MHLTSTVVGSSQADRQDSCKDKRASASLLGPSSQEPQASKPFPVPGMAGGGEQGDRKPPGSEKGETASKCTQKHGKPFTGFPEYVPLPKAPELTGEPDRSQTARVLLPTARGVA